MAQKTPPYKHWPEWTTARFFGFLRSGLREKFGRYPVKYAALNQACTEYRTPVGDDWLRFKTGKRAGEIKTHKRYQCNSCCRDFMQKDVQVDHIIPAGSLRSFDDLPGFAERLFCAPEGLQVLCSPCHDIKTKEDKA